MAKRTTIPSREEHAKLWAALDPKERRTLLKAVAKGEALPNRKQARIAIGVARQQQSYWRWAWLIGVAIAVIAIPQGIAAMLVQAALGALFMGALSSFRLRRAKAAESANIAVVEGRRR